METKHTPEQYQLSLHIAALETIIDYGGEDVPPEILLQLDEMKSKMLIKIEEINLRVSPKDLFEHIASFYQTKH